MNKKTLDFIEGVKEQERTCIWKRVAEKQLDLYGEDRVGMDMKRCALDCDGLWDWCKFYYTKGELKNGRPH